MKILAVANQKGGVGKSTLAVHLAYAALERSMRVLLVDMDKQGSLSLTFKSEHVKDEGLVASSLFTNGAITGMPERLSEKLSIIRADNGLLSVDKAENQVIKRPRKNLQVFDKEFDLCLIDTPPLLGIRLMASLTAADFVITPVSVGLYEMAGIRDLMQTIQVIRTQGFNQKLKHLGMLPTKTNNRSKREKEALDTLRSKWGSAILDVTLPQRAAVPEAIASRVPVWQNTKGESHLNAGKEWKKACELILKGMEK